MLGTKEDVMELENNIDEYIFFQFQSAYQELLTEPKKVYGKDAHAILMQYLEFRNAEAIEKIVKDRGFNHGLSTHKNTARQ